MQFRYDIQGLRAFAVLFVLVFHINRYWLPGGFIGVDMFFVISGYLISSIVLGKKNQGTFSFKDFYLSRIKRIVPAYLVFLIITSLLVSVIFLSTDANKYRVALLWSSIFNSNNYFSTLDTYFGASSSENPLLHTWTLAIEMQFYLILPLILILFSIKNSKWILILLTIALTAYSSYHIFYLNNKDEMYFSLLARSPEFFLGVLINYFRFDFTNRKNLANILSLIGFILLFVSVLIIKESFPFPGITAFIPCIGTCLILISKDSYLNNFISRKPFVFIGELSYSIYLWHWPILALYRYYYGVYEIDNNYHLTIIIVVVLLLSWLSYTYVENSFRQKGLDRKFVLSFFFLIIILGISAFSIKKINATFNNYPIEYASPEAIGLRSHGSTYVFDEIRGDTLAADTLLLLGDSHAFVMKPYLELLGKRNNFCFRSVTNDRYPPIPGIDAKDIKPLHYIRQEKLVAITKDKLNKSKVIILTRAWHLDIPSFNNALENLIKQLSKDQHLILLSDYPRLNANPIKINRSISKNKSSHFQWKETLNEPSKSILALTKKYKNVHFLNLSKNNIFDDVPFYKDKVMYYDESHLNRYGSERYALSTEKDFMALLETLLKAD